MDGVYGKNETEGGRGVNRNKVFRVASALAAVFLALGAGSVRGAELSKRMIVEAVGLDYENGEYLVTLQALDTHAAGAGTDPNEKGGVARCYRFAGATPAQALAQIPAATGLTPLYSQARLIVLGPSVYERDVSAPLDFFTRGCHTRGDVLLAAAVGDAGALLEADFGSTVPGAAVLEDAITAGAADGDCCETRLGAFENLLFSGADAAFCPLIGTRDTPERGIKTPWVAGTVFFRDGKKDFACGRQTTNALLVLTDKIKKATLTAQTPAGRYTLRAVSVKTKVRAHREAGALQFAVEVKAACDLTEFSGPPGEADPAAARAQAESDLQALLEETLKTLYYKYGADICRFGRRAAFYGGLPAGETAAASVTVKVTIRQGAHSEHPPTKKPAVGRFFSFISKSLS